jgi:hypothetical protein
MHENKKTFHGMLRFERLNVFKSYFHWKHHFNGKIHYLIVVKFYHIMFDWSPFGFQISNWAFSKTNRRIVVEQFSLKKLIILHISYDRILWHMKHQPTKLSLLKKIHKKSLVCSLSCDCSIKFGGFHEKLW